MSFGRTCSSSASIPACTASQQHHCIPGQRLGAHNVLTGSSRNNGAKLHTLGHISGMINLGHLTGGCSHLIAIRAVSVCCHCGNFPLRQFSGQSLFNGCSGITAARNPHGLVYVRPAGHRIPDCATKTSGSTAKGLNLCRMVMCFIFEHDQPVLLLTVHIHLCFNAASVYFFRFIQIGKQAFFFHLFHCNGGNIH